MQTPENKLFPLIRAVLTIAGTYLVGTNLFGLEVNESLWQEIAGGVLVAASFVWSFMAKTLSIEIFQSSILKIVMIAGGLLVTSGKITGESLNIAVAALTALLPVLYSFLSKKKSQEIADGEIHVTELAK